MTRTLFALLCMTAVACGAQSDDSLSEGEDGASDDESAESESSDISVAGRWRLSSDVRSAGMRQNVSYDSADSCASGDRPGTKKMKSFLKAKFPSEILKIEGFVCRNIRGSSGLSMHSTGRAMDIYIPESRGDADNTKGDKVAAFLIRNAEKIGVQFIIWDRSKWKPGQEEVPYGGVHPHDDHLHVELTEEAGDMQTAYFRGVKLDETGAGGGGSPSPAPSPSPSPGSDDGCYSFTLKKQMPKSSCVQARNNELWYRCTGASWAQTEEDDAQCVSKHPL
jgi:hypothetical protein